MAANVVVTLFVNGKQPSIADYNVQAEYPVDSEMYDELASMLKDVQLDIQPNGDIILYGLLGNEQEYIGVQKYGDKCTMHQMITKYITDND